MEQKQCEKIGCDENGKWHPHFEVFICLKDLKGYDDWVADNKYNYISLSMTAYLNLN